MPYNVSMIKTYTSKALEAFATKGDGSKLPVQNHNRVRRILLTLDVGACQRSGVCSPTERIPARII